MDQTNKPLLADRQWKNLQPFLYRKGARQRIILCLVASGLTIKNLMGLTVGEIRAMHFPPEIDYCLDEVFYSAASTAYAFIDGDGAKLPNTYYHRLIRYAGKSAAGIPMSQEMLRAAIK